MSAGRFLLLVLASSPATAAPLSGIGKSIDGDSLMVGEAEVRLHGIDAPEGARVSVAQLASGDGVMVWAALESTCDAASGRERPRHPTLPSVLPQVPPSPVA